jgi:hypothetical protein
LKLRRDYVLLQVYALVIRKHEGFYDLFGAKIIYRRTSISGTKKAQITFPLRHFFPLKVVK